ncbi:MAG: hypothetical protein UY10_C0023G0002 [Microgenomates group bacterium GW2011_GWA2_47_8]|nr:MAG: hypothetical protein UY10_C0023G0002 [Microgenomates group bacterium GW2011_GWA2_47_8]
MTVKKFILTAAVLFFSLGGAVYASYGSEACQPIYGGGETCVLKGNLLINKSVKNPQTNEFVDNLSRSNDPKYMSGQIVEFQLTVTNTGNKKINEIEVTDILPNYLDFQSGPGTFDSNNKKLTFKIVGLEPNQSKTYTVKAKVSGNISFSQAVNCVVNQAKAVSGDNESSDIAQLCIEKTVTTTKGGLPVMPAPGLKQTPATGPEMLGLAALIPAAGAGLFLRKFKVKK